MHYSHFMLSGACTDMPSEALPLLHDNLPRRQYQSYCETVASSRPPSPDSLIPKPLRITPAHPPKPVLDVRSSSPYEVDQNTALVLSAANGPEQNVDVVTLPKTGSYSKRRIGPPSRKPLPKDTISVDINHITQTVTPRGSHSLAPTVVTVYARTPSHPRVQPSIPSQGATFQTVFRRPVQRYGNRAKLEHHPLPSLPLEPLTIKGNVGQLPNTKGNRLRVERFGQPDARTPGFVRDDFEAEREGLLPQQTDQYTVAHRPVPEPYIRISQSEPRPRVASEEPLSLTNLTVPLAPRMVHLRESSESPRRGNLLDNHTQFPSSDGLYVPRGLLSDIADDRRATRRTIPKDANLRYQFGELPYRDSDLSLPISSHRGPYHHQKQFPHLLQATHTSAPSLDSTDTQLGPRPAPWGTFSDLELHRRQRGNARKHAQIRQNRLTADSLSSYRFSNSSDSLCKDPKSEVKEYREQIRRVYPDMEFDGNSGSGGRGWCCNVM